MIAVEQISMFFVNLSHEDEAKLGSALGFLSCSHLQKMLQHTYVGFVRMGQPHYRIELHTIL